jgi:hypothetical protein
MPSPHVQEQRNLAPGQGAIVLAELTHRGSSQPRFVIALTSPIGIHASLGMLVLGACLVIGYFLWQENRYGRFARIVSPKCIDSAWLESKVFAYRPEVVSAIALGWGSNVVATILASWYKSAKWRRVLRNDGFADPSCRCDCWWMPRPCQKSIRH